MISTSNDYPLALVTGAAHRLGRTFALSLARQGYAIALHYNHSKQEAEETAREIANLNVPTYFVQADLTSFEQITNLFSTIDSFSSQLHVLVNSAAIMYPGNVHSISLKEWDDTVNLNLRAPFFCAQEAVKRMTTGGLIVNITDVGAQKAWSRFPAYTISKAGLESLTRVLARALAPNIRVNAIAPGLVLPAQGTAPNDKWEILLKRLPINRSASLDEISAALEFLLRNEYITGQTITIDGGYSLI